MLALWLLSIPLKDASIVDIFWGPGFAVAAWVAFALSSGAPARQWLLAILTTVWAARLGLYLLWRKRGHGDDQSHPQGHKIEDQGGRSRSAKWHTEVVSEFGLRHHRPDRTAREILRQLAEEKYPACRAYR